MVVSAAVPTFSRERFWSDAQPRNCCDSEMSHCRRANVLVTRQRPVLENVMLRASWGCTFLMKRRIRRLKSPSPENLPRVVAALVGRVVTAPSSGLGSHGRSLCCRRGSPPADLVDLFKLSHGLLWLQRS